MIKILSDLEFMQTIKMIQKNVNELLQYLENFLPSKYSYLIQEFSEMPDIETDGSIQIQQFYIHYFTNVQSKKKHTNG